MKNMSLLVLLYIGCSTGNVFGQQQLLRSERYQIESDSLVIGHSKTTTIVFPYSVKSVDRGSNAVLVQKGKAVENILQLKAAHPNFIETNLTVVTSDGQLYSFVLNYNEETPILNWIISKAKGERQEHLVSPDNENEVDLHDYAALASYERKKLRGVKDKKFGMKFQLNGLFIYENVMYYRIRIENNSNINYDISQLRFFIRDQKKSKRTASQEIEIKPIYIYNSPVVIEQLSEVCAVFTLEKFTIPDKKYLAIQLMENRGGRHLELRVKNGKMMQLSSLPKL